MKNEKVFTKEMKNNIINEKYNPLNYEREGLFMKGTEDIVLDEVVKELSKKYNRSEKFIKLLTKICVKFKINNYKETIKNFLTE